MIWIFLFHLLTTCTGDSRQTKFYADKRRIDNEYRDPLYMMSTSSLSVCTASCSGVPGCYGVSLHVGNNDCRGYSQFADPTPVTGTRVWKKYIRCHPHYNYIQASDMCWKWYQGSWDDGNSLCEEEDGRLIVLNTDTKLDSVRQSILDAGEEFYYWVGGRLVSGAWTWIDDTPVDLTAFGRRQPDGSGTCVGWHLTRHQALDDGKCYVVNRYICEKP